MPQIPKHVVWPLILLTSVVATRSTQDAAPVPAVDRTRLDTTCSPCKDFYRFANGAWLDTVTIPPGQAAEGPLAELGRRNQLFIAQLLDSLAFASERHARTAVERKVGVFYAACIDSTASQAQALAAVKPELELIDSIRAPADLGRAVGRLQRHRVRAMFDVGEGSDAAGQIGITLCAFFNAFSLPSFSRYQGTDSTSARSRELFVTRVAQAFERFGDAPDSAGANARRVLAFETAMWRARTDDSDVAWLALEAVRREAPAFGWDGFASGLGRPDLQSLGLRPREMARIIDSLATRLPLADWRAYLRWRLINGLAAALNPGEGFASESQRRQRCASQTTQLLGDGVARAYVDRAFPPEAKAAAMDMVEEMLGLLRERILGLDWLGAESRRKAVTKVDSIRLWIGYPNQMDDLSGLVVRNESFAQNRLAALRYATDRQLALVGTRFDRDRWAGSNVAHANGTYYMQNALDSFLASSSPACPVVSWRHGRPVS